MRNDSNPTINNQNSNQVTGTTAATSNSPNNSPTTSNGNGTTSKKSSYWIKQVLKIDIEVSHTHCSLSLFSSIAITKTAYFSLLFIIHTSCFFFFFSLHLTYSTITRTFVLYFDRSFICFLSLLLLLFFFFLLLNYPSLWRWLR